ncbi:MAG TPA: PrgI family protein [Candidatus Saccharibacteria bacterium]|nr:PrgI family protein [Candidatus Saccharibacteria bacterium]
MAVYKVPQDVEAEDKLIGPFSFRQFIYLIIAALGIFVAWMLSQVFIGLFILPLPIVVMFLAIALPLRKDQPMETYLIAMVKFFFKPRKRLWDPEGTISLVQITAPKVIEGPQLKEVGGYDAAQRLAYLAQVVDTKGWSTRGATSANDNMADIFVAEASQAEDVLDVSSSVGQSINQRITETDQARMEAARAQMQAAVTQVSNTPVTDEVTQDTPQKSGVDEVASSDDIHYNPYPNAMHQHVVEPGGKKAKPKQERTEKAQPQKQPGADTVSPDIMRLANNNDLSISALSREAHRLENSDEEVVIKLH